MQYSISLNQSFKILLPQDSLAEWSKALASGASPQGRGLEPHSCQLAHKRQRAQLHVDRARSALLASSGSCPQQNKGEMCCLSVFYPGYPGCLVDMSSPASMPAVVSSRELQCCCCCCSEHDSLAEWSKALASGASPQGRGLEPHSCHFCLKLMKYPLKHVISHAANHCQRRIHVCMGC